MGPLRWIKAVLFILALVIAPAALAVTIQERIHAGACALSLSDTQISGNWRPLRQAMNYALTHPQELTSELRGATPIIHDVGAKLGEGGFGYVYSIDTSRGRFAAKAWHTTGVPPDEYLVGIVIQMAFSELGLAPRVHGLVLPVDDQEMRFNRPDRPGIAPPLVLVMDLVPEARVIRGLRLENSWDASEGLSTRIRSVIQQADQVMRHLLISPYDEQMLISEATGAALYNDFDLFSIVSNFRRYCFAKPAGESIAAMTCTAFKNFRSGYVAEAVLAFLGVSDVQHR